MKRSGRWLPALGLVACLSATACKKEEPTAPAPVQPTPPRPADPVVPPPVDPPPTQAATPPPPATNPTPPAEPQGEWTQAMRSTPRLQVPPLTLREVRTARNDGFDRVVFQFEGEQVPAYRIEYLDVPAVSCGSGDEVPVAGAARLQVTLMPAQAHVGGEVTVADRARKPALPQLLELKLTCDFEAEVTWVLGVKERRDYRVLELQGPARLVVDMR